MQREYCHLSCSRERRGASASKKFEHGDVKISFFFYFLSDGLGAKLHEGGFAHESRASYPCQPQRLIIAAHGCCLTCANHPGAILQMNMQSASIRRLAEPMSCWHAREKSGPSISLSGGLAMDAGQL